MITAVDLTKRYGDVTAVDALTFTVEPGRITGFLGPNGAGKSTTMRLILGLDEPSGGHVTVDGKRYRELPDPLRTVGALVDPAAVDPKRSAADHLRWLARSNGIALSRVEEVLGAVGLTDVASRRVEGFSLGMRQRLGLAAALIGDPETLLFDEPINGLDPEGISWFRTFVRSLADEGRTIFLSSHLMTEMAHTADHLIVIGRGHVIADASMAELLETHGRTRIRVRASDRQPSLVTALAAQGAGLSTDPDGALLVEGLDAGAVGAAAADQRVPLLELVTETPSLEDAFFELTNDTTAYKGDLASISTGAQE